MKPLFSNTYKQRHPNDHVAPWMTKTYVSCGLRLSGLFFNIFEKKLKPQNIKVRTFYVLWSSLYMYTSYNSYFYFIRTIIIRNKAEILQIYKIELRTPY